MATNSFFLYWQEISRISTFQHCWEMFMNSACLSICALTNLSIVRYLWNRYMLLAFYYRMFDTEIDEYFRLVYRATQMNSVTLRSVRKNSLSCIITFTEYYTYRKWYTIPEVYYKILNTEYGVHRHYCSITGTQKRFGYRRKSEII